MQASEESKPTDPRSRSLSRDGRSVLAVFLLVLEVLALRQEFTTDHLIGLGSWWTRLLVLTRYGMPFSLCLAAGVALGLGRNLLDHYRGKLGPLSEPRTHFPWQAWSVLHVLGLAATLACASYLFQAAPEQAPWLGWSAIGFGLAILVWFLSLVDLVLPLRGMAWLLWSQRLRVSLGLLAGLVAYGVGSRLLGEMPFWRPMGAGTMWLAYHLLGLVYSDLLLEPEILLIGTQGFDVRISRWCSGYEGTFLFLGFFSLFLFLNRARLRFPRVLWLLPLGIGLVYLLNGLRIAILVVLGTEFSQELAMDGFHVNAGWPFFGITAWLSVLVAMRSPYFTSVERMPPEQPRSSTVNLYGLYLGPLVLSIAAIMGARSLTLVGWVGDVLKLLGVCVLIWIYRKEYRALLLRPSAWGLCFGLLALALWSLLFNGEPTTRWESSVLIPRVLGFVLITPLAEELFFRGFLLRRLASSDFESVDLRSLGPWPFVVSSLAFGVLHEQWIAGSVCGLLFALAYRQRGRMGDALVAHVSTNAALVIGALFSGDWGLVS